MAVNRINGMVSGFDTETMVKDLMKVEQGKVDRAKQQKELISWQKDGYKEFSSLLRGLQSEFLDVLKPTSNLRSRTMFNVFSAGVSLDGAANAAVTAKTSDSSQKGSITIDQITKLATADTWTSSSQVKVLEGAAVNVATLNAAIAGGQTALSFTVDGTTKNLTLAGGYADFDALKTDLQTKLNTAFGVGKVSVGGTMPDNKLSFDSIGSTIAISGDLVGQVGFTTGDSSILNTGTTLASAFGLVSDPGFTINGVTSTTMGIKSTDTIKQLMDKINSSAAGVQISYSTVSDKFVMKSTKEGIANNIELTDTDGLFANSLKLQVGNRVSGQDAELIVDGVQISRSSNTFDIDGTTLTLKQTYTPANPGTSPDILITIGSDPSSAVKTIKSFVEKYNELIDKISTKTLEKRNRDYLPLTETQRKAMSEDEVKLWESKAKSGMLRSDTTLQDIATKLRASVIESVSGLGISLKDVGITTSTVYSDNGKLVLEENKLSQALADRPSEVMELFTKQSSVSYSDAANRGTRNAENGWANRINDIFQDNIRLTRDDNGKRGILIDKAGYEKDSSEGTSSLAKQMFAKDAQIAKLLDSLATQESLYYAKFSRMESMLSRMNTQFSSVFGSTTGGS